MGAEATMTMADEAAVARPRTLRRWVLIGLAVVVAGLLSWFYERHAWEWSFVDDSGNRTAALAAYRHHGVLGGVGTVFHDYATAGHAFGRFQPFYWLLVPIFYLMPAGPAHLVRLLVVVGALVTPAVAARRRAARLGAGAFVVPAWCALVLAANIDLYNGLNFLSLQEVTGAFLVGVGLAVPGDRTRTVIWALAALTKEPFAWLLLAWGIALIISRRGRILGAVSAAGGLGCLATAAIFARTGTYSSRIFDLSPHVIRAGATSMVHKSLPGLAVLLLGAWLLNVRPSWLLPRDAATWAVGAAGALYAANVIPWGDLGEWYAIAPLYLLGCALSLAAAENLSVVRWQAPRRWPALAVAAVLLVPVFVAATPKIRLQLNRNDTYVSLRQWASSLPSNGVLIGTNGIEAATRLTEVVKLHEPTWNDRVVFVPADGSYVGPRPDYYVTTTDDGAVDPKLTGAIVLTAPRATVYKTPAG